MDAKLLNLRRTIEDAVKACQSDKDREAVTAALQDGVKSAETPGAFLWQMMLQPHQYAVTRAALELDVFHKLAGGPLSAEKLAEQCGADQLLVVRLMRVLVAMGVVNEEGTETYVNGPAGDFLSKVVGLEGGLKFMFDLAAQAVIKLPQTLAQSGWKNPQGDPIIFQKAFGESATAFSYLGAHPSSLGDFNNLMGAQRFNRLNWFDFFPVKERLLDGFGKGTLLVDVGGAQGFELQQFKERFPEAQGELVLQDLPGTIDSIEDLDESIVRMKHDFFTPQPKKGARVYYFRSIFHDWTDEKCREILRNLKPAMTNGYSKIVINDWIIPDKKAMLYPCLLDINMMALFSSMERTESQWRALLESEGFEVRFWSVPGTEGCIEAWTK